MDRGSCHAGLPDPTEYSRHETKLRTRVLLWISIFFLMSLPLATLSTSGMTLTLQAVEVERLAGESQSSSVQSAGTCRLGSRIWGNSENESHGSVKNWWSQEPKQKIWALPPHHKDTCMLCPLRSSPRGIRAFLGQWGNLLPSVLFCLSNKSFFLVLISIRRMETSI